MSKLSYRQVLKKNDRKTYFVVSIFLLLYIFIGLVADIIFKLSTIPRQSYVVGESLNKSKFEFSDLFLSLVTFQSVPFFTLLMIVLGVISVLVALSFNDKLMLWGSEYKEINGSGIGLSKEEKQLYNIIEELKIAANLSYMPKVYLIDANYLNAFASGYSEKSAMIGITSALMNKLTRSEVQAVMAHEISHIKHMDIKLTLFVGVLSNLMLLVVDLLFEFMHLTNRKNSDSSPAKTVAILLVFALKIFMPIITLVLTLFLSRTREYMADAGAVKLTRDPDSMASALIKIKKDYSENEYEDTGVSIRKASYIYNPLKSFSDVFSTHPSVEKRLSLLGVDEKELEFRMQNK